MKITNVEATNYLVPVKLPLLNKTTVHNFIIVKVETDEGICGHGVPGGGLIQARFAVKEFVNKDIAPILIGKNPLETEKRWYELWRAFNVRGQSGVWSSGVSAVDIALWDIKGKALDQPIYRLLGGNSDEASTYISFGLSDYNRSQLIKAATRLVTRGHDKLKMIVSWSERATGKYTWSLEEDIKRVRSVREAIGDKISLMVDGNCRNSYTRALKIAKSIEPYDIDWFEEPLFANDIHLLAQLRNKTKIPISATAGHKWRFRDLIVNGSIDIVQPNIEATGGYTEALKVAHLAQAFNLPVNAKGFQGMHLIGAVDNGWLVEIHYIQWKIYEALFRNLPKPEKGKIKMPQKPGLGFEPKEKNLIKYLEE